MRVNKENLLSQVRLKEVLSYDLKTGAFTWLVAIGRRGKVGNRAGSINKVYGYVNIGIDGYQYRAHRLVWLYSYGYFPSGDKRFIDHVNGRRRDNRLVNLRTSSTAENNKNQQKQNNNTSGTVGIRRVEQWNGTKTKKHSYWVAYWSNESGKQTNRKFNIGIYGEEQAKQMAIDCRIEQIRLLELNHNIIYSPRHGT